MSQCFEGFAKRLLLKVRMERIIPDSKTYYSLHVSTPESRFNFHMRTGCYMIQGVLKAQEQKQGQGGKLN